MFELKIRRVINKSKKVEIKKGEVLVDMNGREYEESEVDNSGRVLIENGKEKKIKARNRKNKSVYCEVLKTEEEIYSELDEIKIKEERRIARLVEKYREDFEKSKKGGVPGPVADFVVMKIANEYKGKFKVKAVRA